MSFQSTALIGADGMLGTELRHVLERNREFGRISCTQFPETDITVPESLDAFLDGARPEIIFNCAAFTNVDECESRAQFAHEINAAAPGRLAVAANRRKALLVHISTDYVFDGEKGTPYTEEDEPRPLSVYAQTKLDGEREVLAKAEHPLIVRTGWLYGRHRWNVVDKMVQMCLSGETLKGAYDLIGSPTWTRDLAEALMALAAMRAKGIYHVVNKGQCSRLEQIQAIAKGLGVEQEVRSVSSDEFKRPAKAPKFSALSVEKYEREVGARMRGWREALLEYIQKESPARMGGTA